MKNFRRIIVFSLIFSLVFSIINVSNASAATPKYGDVKTVQVKLSKADLQKKVNLNNTINKLVNNKAVDGGFLGVLGAQAKSSLKRAGLYGFAGGALLMGIDKLTQAEKKHFASLLDKVNKNKAKGITITHKYKYHKSFDVGGGGGYWILTGKPTYKTY